MTDKTECRICGEPTPESELKDNGGICDECDNCPGIEIKPGVFSGCNQSAGDCPTCGK